MKKALGTIVVALLLILVSASTAIGATEYCPAGGSKQEAQGSELNDVVLEAGTVFCVKGATDATGYLVADGVTTLVDYLGNGHDVSYYVTYGQETTTTTEPEETTTSQPEESTTTTEPGQETTSTTVAESTTTTEPMAVASTTTTTQPVEATATTVVPTTVPATPPSTLPFTGSDTYTGIALVAAVALFLLGLTILATTGEQE